MWGESNSLIEQISPSFLANGRKMEKMTKLA
jgi:hypothetical protein